MRVTFAFATLLAAWTSSVIAAPSPQDTGFISKIPSGHQSGGDEYIVIFNSSHPAPPHVAEVLDRIQLSTNHSDVKYTFNNTVFRGFVANMQTHCIDALNAMSDVSHVEQKLSIESFATQRSGSPWGLQRISSSQPVSGDAKSLDFTYSFDDTKLGAGVDIYVVDTGVRTTHAVFGGRAQVGFSYDTTNTADGDGHGTHVAGTAAGSVFGVASAANIFAVKVLDDKGSGATTDTIAGMDWVIQNHNKRKSQPGFVGSVMSMSWGLGGTSDAIDSVIKSATEAGIHVSVAAGNSGKDACSFSPSDNGGSRSAAVSVGSIGIGDAISSFSNTGPCTDVYAPGENVLSAWKDSDTTIQYLSGTSMACPHVTGVMAYMMAQDTSLGQDPAALKAKLVNAALESQVTGSTTSGDAKKLLNNGVTDGVARILRRWVKEDMEKREMEKRTVTGAPASWVKDLGNQKLGARWEMTGAETQLRY